MAEHSDTKLVEKPLEFVNYLSFLQSFRCVSWLKQPLDKGAQI